MADIVELAARAAEKMSALLRKKKSGADEFINLDRTEAEDIDDIKLSSSLQLPGDEVELYIKTSEDKNTFHRTEGTEEDEQPTVINNLEKGLVAPPVHLTKRMKLAAKRKGKEVHDTAGPKWFDLPATPLTPELKQDLRLLQMRGALDPKRFYKANDSKTLPKYFQIGTYVDNATEYYTDGANKKPRKQPALVEQVLADVEKRKYLKKKFEAMQRHHQRNKRPKAFSKHRKHKRK